MELHFPHLRHVGRHRDSYSHYVETGMLPFEGLGFDPTVRVSTDLETQNSLVFRQGIPNTHPLWYHLVGMTHASGALLGIQLECLLHFWAVVQTCL